MPLLSLFINRRSVFLKKLFLSSSNYFFADISMVEEVVEGPLKTVFVGKRCSKQPHAVCHRCFLIVRVMFTLLCSVADVDDDKKSRFTCFCAKR